MMNRLDGAPSLPIKDEVDLAIDARAKEILREYDVTPEEAAQMARADVMQNMDRSGYPTPEAALARQHQDAGASPESARKQAQNQVRVYGPQGAWGLSREYDTPEGMERLVQAQAENTAADARHQKMYDDYFTVTNAPSHQRALPETERQWADTGRYVAESRRIREAGLHPNTPVDPGTPEQGRRWERFLRDNPEEMARYRPDEFAATQAAEDKKAWADKRPLLVKRYGEEEVQKMEAAQQRGQPYVPNTEWQRERNQVTQDLETASMQGHTPSRAFLQRRDRDRYANVARPRQLRELGLAPEEATEMSDANIRALLRDKREQEKQGRDLLWKQRAMIRGGNAIGAMHLPGTTDWDRAAILGGPTPLAVEAAGNRQLAELGLRVGQGRGFQDNAAAQQDILEQRKREAAINRADTLIKRYPQGWDQMYDAADVEAVRDAVEKQHPGMGDLAVAHLRVRPARAATPPPFGAMPGDAAF